eukprot:CAMPEP_0194036752 /NCGR_PEP_ID=MMETSP0009_2-20130614/9116_1 /TAXON_ID=210454 /ORGANISM="Grammatophora oceanica, Strain CCMP 410" /LENGTH=639 /DNA_ID=CAMNT_0038678635 /DNA_START=42 /DNA_END=1961 /DNA_ORIENTATION=-
MKQTTSLTSSATSSWSRIALFLLLLVGIASAKSSSPRGKNDTWYSRYPSYPEYCSTPDMMENRAIPFLSEPKPGIRGDTRLVHVSTIIRHGARTPWGGRSEDKCWDGFWDNGATSVWNCDLTTFLSPPSPLHVEEEEGWTPAGSDAMFLFEKKYDALQAPLSNELEGSCQAGQLILQGYEQELANGQHLRNAYVYDSTMMDHDARMRLLDLSDTKSLAYQEPVIRYRSDDDQRTLMSGQVLLRGMFGTEFVQHLKNTGTRPVLPVHTADRWMDVLDPNHKTCPKLTDIKEHAASSRGFAKLIRSKEAREVRKYVQRNLGKEELEDGFLDCMMTTICTDRPLPDSIADFGTIGPRALHGDDDDDEDDHDDHDHDDGITSRSWFERLQDFDVSKEAYLMRYKDSQYAKLGMGPLWAEIIEQLEPSVGVSALPPQNKMAIYAGHDSTLIPLMETMGIWDGAWPPYASMLILEMHELIDGQTDRTVYKSDYAFRVLFNGKVLTDRMEGCPPGEELCDVQVFLDKITPIATRNPPDCMNSHSTSPSAVAESKQLLSTPGGFFLVVFVLMITAAFSYIATFYHLTKTMPWSKRRNSSYMKTSYDLELRSDYGSAHDNNGNGQGYRDNPEDDDDYEEDEKAAIQML